MTANPLWQNTVGVVGGGVVGNATAKSLTEHVDEVRVFDTDPKKATHTLEQVLLCDLIFVCLPTPPLKDEGRCKGTDPYRVYEFFSLLSQEEKKRNFVLKSTVPIGTTKYLTKTYGLTNLVHSPEFLTGRCAVTDAHMPGRNIIGYPIPELRTESESYTSRSVGRLLHDLYAKRFPGVRIFSCTSDESEAVKLIQNAFFAVKISFFNEMNWLCEEVGCDWNLILAALLSDGRIAHSHTRVPGPGGGYGWSGSCLPKDICQLIEEMKLRRLDPSVSEAALTRNTKDVIRGMKRRGE